jgi:hypothetical protein
MKLNLFETHDRLIHLQKNQAETIAQGCQECLHSQLSQMMQARASYVYLFAHPRKHDNGKDTRLIWQARLGKPKAQTNSYLFRALSHTDNIEVCWMIPPREQWGQYKKGNITESSWVEWSIMMFNNKRAELEKPFADDVSEEQFKLIMTDIACAIDEEKRMKKLYVKNKESY